MTDPLQQAVAWLRGRHGTLLSSVTNQRDQPMRSPQVGFTFGGAFARITARLSWFLLVPHRGIVVYLLPLRNLPLALLMVVWIAGCSPPNQYQAPPPPAVTVAKPVRQSVTLYLEETGATEAVELVEIRARVAGYLDEIKFEAGQQVKAGDVLYVIQQGEYQAKLKSAQAEVDSAQAEINSQQAALKLAGIELERQKKLKIDNATAQSKVDQAEADLQTAEAAVDSANAAHNSAKAAFDRAELDLQYTTVTSPIDGRVGRSLVKLGNLVGENDATHLTTVVAYDPIYVNFNISERALLQVMRGNDRDTSEKADITETKAYMRRAVDKGFPFVGHLEHADLGVDQSTGTFMIRAVFPNPQRSILPGLFVRVRIPMGTAERAVLIPERSLGADQAGRFVMVVGDDNVVERRNVEVGSKYEDMVVVTEGLNGDESVVIDGIQRSRPGAKVAPKETQLSNVKGDLEIVEEGGQSPNADETVVPAPAGTEPAAEAASSSGTGSVVESPLRGQAATEDSTKANE